MANLTGADKLAIGTANIDRVYLGSTQLWPTATTPVVVQGTPTTGTAANGTTATVTLPSYVSGDYLLLAVSRNQPDASAWTTNANASITEIAHSSRRLSLVRVQPNGTPTTFVLTSSATALWSWCCLNLGQVTPSVQTAVNTIGNSTTSTVEFSAVSSAPATDGNQLVVSVAGTNSTATWTAPASTDTRASLAAAPGLLVTTFSPSSGQSTINVGNADRANNGSTRYETTITALLRA